MSGKPLLTQLLLMTALSITPDVSPSKPCLRELSSHLPPNLTLPSVLRDDSGESGYDATSLHPLNCTQNEEIMGKEPPLHSQLLTSHTYGDTEAPEPGFERASLMNPPSVHKRSRRMIQFHKREDDESLAQLLSFIVSEELRECVLVLAAVNGFRMSIVMQRLVRLPNLRQVVYIESTDDLLGIVWKAQRCRGYLFLLSDPAPLFDFADQMTDSWDYDGRFVVAGLSRDQLEDFTLTMKGKKTANIAGVVKAGKPGEYLVLMNLLYKKEKLSRVYTWRKPHNAPHNLKIFPDKTADLQGAVLTVVTFYLPPNTLHHRAPDGSFLRRYGHDVEVVLAMAQIFNFTANFKDPPPGERWGVLTANGTWNGMVGMLGRGKADIGMGNLFITALGGRMQFQEYTRPYDQEVTCFLTRREGPLPRWQSLGLPFRLSTWLAVLLGLVVSGPVLYCLAKPSVSRSEKLAHRSVVFTSLYTFGMYFRLSQPLIPSRASLRVFVVFLWLYVIILTTGYSCNLTAFLTVDRKSPGIRTLKELYESQLSVFGLGPFFGNTMAESKNEYVRGLAKQFVSLPDFEEISPRLLRNEGVMIQGHRYLSYSTALLTPERGAPVARIIQECFLPFNVAMGLQSHSPLRKNFDRGVSWIFDSGLVNYWFKQTLTLSKKYSREQGQSKVEGENAQAQEETGVSALNLDHVQGIFFILAFGYAVSLLAFSTEVLFGAEEKHVHPNI